MSLPLTVVARIEAHAEHMDHVKAELLKLIEPTKQEDGCLQYDLHQDHENLAVFLFYENWVSREQWQAHMASAHLKAFSEATEGMIERLTLNEMSAIRLNTDYTSI